MSEVFNSINECSRQLEIIAENTAGGGGGGGGADTADITHLGGNAIALNTGVLTAGTQRVTVATTDPISQCTATVDTTYSSKVNVVGGVAISSGINNAFTSFEGRVSPMRLNRQGFVITDSGYLEHALSNGDLYSAGVTHGLTMGAVRNDSCATSRVAANNDFGPVSINEYGRVFTEETSAASIKTNLDSTNTKLDSTNTKIDSTNTKLDTANSNLDSIETKLDTINDSINSVQSTTQQPRINSTHRYKTCGGYCDRIKATEYTPMVSPHGTYDITDFCPPIGTGSSMGVASSALDDDAMNDGATEVTLRYIDNAGVTQTATANLNGTIGVLIGTSIREILEFKCTDWGINRKNSGSIYLNNLDDAGIAAIIFPGYNNSFLQGIEVPVNGHTYLQSLYAQNAEQNNLGTDAEVQIILVERSAVYTYRVLFHSRVLYTKEWTVDLSHMEPIAGSGDGDISFAIYPCMKSLNGSSFDTYGALWLSAMNTDD